MDQIKIDGLSFFAHHGVFDFETKNGQRFVISAVLECDTRKAGQTDDLNCSTSYAEVAEFLVQYLTEHTFLLLEAAVEHACDAVLKQFPLVRGIELELKKPDAPIDLDFESVSVRIHRSWHKAYVALGSNLGDKEGYLRMALEGLDREDTRVTAASDFLVTAPYGEVEQDDFLNAVCEVETLRTPEELLELLHELEQKANRERIIHWGPRTLDLDILFYDNVIMYTEELKIPHVDMQNRDFVLRPLAQIAPYAMHPVLGKSVLQLWKELEETWN